jgi:acyl phosphate:glycerol-3-phosphate acyltransferase
MADGAGIAWVVGGYVAGSLPSTWIVARLRRATAVTEEAARDAGETDAHLVMARRLGGGWAAAAATMDVLKGFVLVLLARTVGGASPTVLALTGTAVVLGHTYPPFAREMAGRGMAATAGVYLALLPVEMVVAGLIIVAGVILRSTGLASTVALALVPVLALVLGEPAAYVWMAAAILVLVMLRRLEGVGVVIRRGVSPARAVWYRAVFDVSLPGPR